MKKIFAVTIAILLSGCGDNGMDPVFNQPAVTLEQVCEANEELCTNIAADSMCKRSRHDALVGYHQFKLYPNSEAAYKELMLLEKYIECAGRAKLVEFVPVEQKFETPIAEMSEKELESRQRYADSIKKRKADKESSYYHAKKIKNKIEHDYAGSQNPYFLYYEWTRLSNQEARDTLVELYESGNLPDYELQYHVAHAIAKSDMDKATKMFLDILSIYPKEQYTDKTTTDADKKGNLFANDNGRIHFAIFRNLTTTYFQKGDYERAFVFATLLDLNEDLTADSEMIIDYMRNNSIFSGDRVDDLEYIADQIDDSLEEGSFKPEMVARISFDV